MRTAVNRLAQRMLPHTLRSLTAVNRLAQRMLPHTLRSLAVNDSVIVSFPRCLRQLGIPRF